MKIETYAQLIALWIEAEEGPSTSPCPEGLTTGEEMFGQTYPEQARDFLAGQPNYWALRPALWERHILRIGCSPAHAASLDPWEADVERQLQETPLLMRPRETGTERLERLKRENDAAIALALLPYLAIPQDRKPVGKTNEPKSLRDRAPKRGRAA